MLHAYIFVYSGINAKHERILAFMLRVVPSKDGIDGIDVHSVSLLFF